MKINNWKILSLVIVLTISLMSCDLFGSSSGESVTQIVTGNYTISEAGEVTGKNGTLTIKASVGTGTVTIKDGVFTSVVSNAPCTIAVCSGVKVDKLRLNKNAKIVSVKSQAADRYASGRAVVGDKEPEIGILEVAPDADVIVEGGSINRVVSESADDGSEGDVVITKDSTASIRDMIQSKNGIEVALNLELDSEYADDGVRIKISDRREGAQILEVFKVSNNGSVWEQVAWIADMSWESAENRAKVLADTYVYEYLEPGREYDFVFHYYKYEYVDSNGNASDNVILLNADVIKVNAKKGKTSPVAVSSEVAVNVDNDGNYTWVNPPALSTLKNAKLVMEASSIIEDKWTYIGSYEKEISSGELLKNGNVYRDFNLYNTHKMSESDEMFLYVYYFTEGNRFPICESNKFKLKKEYYPVVSISSQNILSFSVKPNPAVIPVNAEGFYIWVYVGDTGSYIAYKDKEKFEDIDLNLVINSNTQLEKAIKENDNKFNIDMAWYKTEIDSETKKADNKWISSVAHQDDIDYKVSEGYETAKVTVEGTKVIISKAGEKLLAEYKKLGTKIGIDVWGGPKGEDWVWGHDTDYTVGLEGGEIELESAIALQEKLVTDFGNKVKISCWLKTDDGSWISQVAPDFEIPFTSSEFEAWAKPVVIVKENDNVLRFSKAPGEKRKAYVSEKYKYTSTMLYLDVVDKDGNNINFYSEEIKDFEDPIDLNKVLAENEKIIAANGNEYVVVTNFMRRESRPDNPYWDEWCMEIADNVTVSYPEVPYEWKRITAKLENNVIKLSEGGAKYIAYLRENKASRICITISSGGNDIIWKSVPYDFVNPFKEIDLSLDLSQNISKIKNGEYTIKYISFDTSEEDAKETYSDGGKNTFVAKLADDQALKERAFKLSSEWRKPSVSIENNIVKITKPGENYAQYLKSMKVSKLLLNLVSGTNDLAWINVDYDFEKDFVEIDLNSVLSENNNRIINNEYIVKLIDCYISEEIADLNENGEKNTWVTALLEEKGLKVTDFTLSSEWLPAIIKFEGKKIKFIRIPGEKLIPTNAEGYTANGYCVSLRSGKEGPESWFPDSDKWLAWILEVKSLNTFEEIDFATVLENKKDQLVDNKYKIFIEWYYFEGNDEPRWCGTIFNSDDIIYE